MQYNPHVQTRSLYIHWPFCPYKCHFCPFVAIAGHDQFMNRYHTALVKEIKDFGAQAGKQPIETIFFGGGTPSTYPLPLLLDTFGTLEDMFEIDTQAEITIEVNPGTVSPEHLQVWKHVGINRLSIGVQSLKDEALKSLNRHQSAAQVLHLLKQAAPLFDNISVDLILGLPEVSSTEWQELLAQVVTWPIKHVSIYFLTIHENTPLYFKVQQNKVDLPPDETIIPLYHWTVEWLARHGFEQYELSNFAKPGYESRHNTVYWERKPYKGFGLGACSFDGALRLQNEKNLMKYMAAVDQNQSHIISVESLSADQIGLEKLMLGLRRRSGVLLDEITQGLDEHDRLKRIQAIERLKSHEFLFEREGRLVLTPRGLLLENEVIVQIARD